VNERLAILCFCRPTSFLDKVVTFGIVQASPLRCMEISPLM
jgi:hypothetical protein